MTDYVAVDMESTGIDPRRDRLLGVGMYMNGKYGWYKDNFPTKVADYTQVYHTGNFDIKWGIPGLHLDHDIANMSALLPDSSHDLEFLAMKYLHAAPWKGSIKRTKMGEEPEEKVKAYNKQDCVNTHDLFPILYEELKKKGQDGYYEQYSRPLRTVLNKVEDTGIRVDIDKLTTFQSSYKQTCDRIEKAVVDEYHTEIGLIEGRLLIKEQDKVKTEAAKAKKADNPPKFNINSSQQLLQLFKLLGYELTNADGKPSTDESTLTKLRTPLSREILKYRTNKKLKEYFDSYLELQYDGRLYPFYHQYRAITGRLSSSDPNIQQVPVRDNPEVRECFIPDDGKVFVIPDLSQIELRLAAHYSEDRNLIKSILSGEDFHSATAKLMFGLTGPVSEVKENHNTERNIAKTVVYLSQYGGGAEQLQDTLAASNILYSVEECRDFLKYFRKAYPQLDEYKRHVGWEAERMGYVKNLFGRKVWTPIEEARHKGFNYKVQSSASDLLCLSTIYIDKALEGMGRIIALIHDELIVETEQQHVDTIKNLLQYALIDRIKGLRVPLAMSVGVGTSWGAK